MVTTGACWCSCVVGKIDTSGAIFRELFCIAFVRRSQAQALKRSSYLIPPNAPEDDKFDFCPAFFDNCLGLGVLGMLGSEVVTIGARRCPCTVGKIIER